MQNPFDILMLKLKEIEDQTAELAAKMEAEKDPVFMNRQEAMDLLGIKSSTLWRLNKDGVIKAYKLGRKVLFKKAELLDSIKSID